MAGIKGRPPVEAVAGACIARNDPAAAAQERAADRQQKLGSFVVGADAAPIEINLGERRKQGFISVAPDVRSEIGPKEMLVADFDAAWTAMRLHQDAV